MKRIYINDIILNASVLVLCAFVPLVMFFASKENEKTVVIKHDGEVVSRIKLSQNEEVEVNGVTVVVKDNKAYISESDCPDGLCMAMKKAENGGDSIVCVPNKVSVTIVSQRAENNEKEGLADVVAG